MYLPDSQPFWTGISYTFWLRINMFLVWLWRTLKLFYKGSECSICFVFDSFSTGSVVGFDWESNLLFSYFYVIPFPVNLFFNSWVKKTKTPTTSLLWTLPSKTLHFIFLLTPQYFQFLSLFLKFVSYTRFIIINLTIKLYLECLSKHFLLNFWIKKYVSIYQSIFIGSLSIYLSS